MHFKGDYSQRIVLNHQDIDWVGSPLAGVERRMLDRIGNEVAKATSVVRYRRSPACRAAPSDTNPRRASKAIAAAGATPSRL